ncbi:hypothetical protein MPF19_12455 [Polaribacter sp. Z014]|uniref:hypothetical protein n=1 Tax=unclassified Polaribacter TaxID=196858 RepID=UPI00193B11D1|nr:MULTISPECIES: hypothetical protein [unclassified Polaribacter]MCL7764230.1 hypothetical protein [Polaribacter sp. Z014]QVY65811.1 hypothetical protein JOP69_00535 [Polaribacter sp. Q13]
MIKRTIFTIILTTLILFISCKEKDAKTSNTKEPKLEKQILKDYKPADSIDKKVAIDSVFKIDHYICYTFNDDKSKRIWIGFSKNKETVKLKYEGQKEPLILKHSKEEFIEGGAHPTIINYYDEIYNGKVNGAYKLTHSGIWDYVKYIRGKDKKEFNFTIDHNSNPYGSSPCF